MVDIDGRAWRERENVGRRHADTLAREFSRPWAEAAPILVERLSALVERVSSVEISVDRVTDGVDRLVRLGDRLERVHTDQDAMAMRVAKAESAVAVVGTRVHFLILILTPIGVVFMAWLFTAKLSGLEERILETAAASTRDTRVMAIISSAPLIADRTKNGHPTVSGLRRHLAKRHPGITAAERDLACALAPPACEP